MEARAELRQPRMSKGLVAIVALGMMLGLGLVAGTVVANLNGSAATTTQLHSISVGKGGAAIGAVRHGGVQTVEDNKAAPVVIRGVSPDAQDRKAAQKVSGNAFIAPDAADLKYWGSAPKWFTPMPTPSSYVPGSEFGLSER